MIYILMLTIPSVILTLEKPSASILHNEETKDPGLLLTMVMFSRRDKFKRQ
jgi:hypothetical protein